MAAADHGLSLGQSGTLQAWGRNDFGQASVPNGLSAITAIAAGRWHSLALRSDQKVVAWGATDVGLDYGQTTVPASLDGVSAIAAGDYHSLALTTGGTLVAWGKSDGGSCAVATAPDFQAAQGTLTWAAGDTGDKEIVLTVAGDSEVEATEYFLVRLSNPVGAVLDPDLAAGTITIEDDDSAALAFDSASSSLAEGDPDPEPFSLTFSVKRLGATTGSASIAWSTQAGTATSAVDFVADAGVLEWEPGDSSLKTITVTLIPDLDVESNETFSIVLTNPVGASLVGASQLTITILDDDSLASPGTVSFASDSQAVVEGDSGTTTVSVTVSRTGGSSGELTVPWSTSSGTALPFATTGIAQIGSGYGFTVARRSDNSVVAWGQNEAGQTQVPADLGPVVSIATGHSHTLALRANGTVVAWGSNDSGACAVPAQLGSATAIAAGYRFSLALVNGSVAAWGSADYGVSNPPASASDGNVVAIAAGFAHAVALKSDGTVVAWGNNDGNRATPPSTLTHVAAIAAGGAHTLALRQDGTVIAWGDSAFDVGQFTVPSQLGQVSAIAAGNVHSLALLANGTVMAWGGNGFGQSSVPTGLGGVIALAAGDLHSVALKADGSLVAWGKNADGQAATSSAADYLAAQGTLTWAAGQSGPKTISVTLPGDTILEPDEWFRIALQVPSAGTLGTSQHTVTIQNDDSPAAPGTIGFASTSQGVVEGTGGTTVATVAVSRSGGSSGAASVAWATAPGSAGTSDFTLASGTLTWAAGDAADKLITLTISGDGAVEPDETFAIGLASAAGAALGASQHTITILNDDSPAERRPTITSPAADPVLLSVYAGQTKTVAFSATDPDGGALSWQVAVGNDAAVTCGISQTGTLSVTGGTPTSAPQAVEVTVSDPDGNQATRTVQVSVLVYVPPQIVNRPQSDTDLTTPDTVDLVAVAGQPVEFLLAASTAPGLVPTYAITSGNLPTGLVLDISDGRAVISGSSAVGGTFALTIDDGVGTSSTPITLTVLPATPLEVGAPVVPQSAPGQANYGAFNPGSVANYQALSAALAGKSASQARAFWWDGLAGSYQELPTLPSVREQPWRAAWLASTSGVSLPATAIPQALPYAITLAPGWTFFGVPAVTTVAGVTATTHAWSGDFDLQDANGVTVSAGQDGILGAAVAAGPWRWNGTAYARTTALGSGGAYWLKNLTASTYRLVRVGTGSGTLSPAPMPILSLDRGIRPAESQPPAPPSGQVHASSAERGGGDCGAGSLYALILLGSALALRRGLGR